MVTSFQKTTINLAFVAGGVIALVAGCGQNSASTPNPGTQDQHPHTTAMLKMIAVMERKGYHPALTERMQKSFAEDPVAWLGPWHIAAADDSPYQTEWRLTIYHRDTAPQPHSFVSVEGDMRFSESLVAALIAEWERMAPVGLPKNVVKAGSQLVLDAAERFARERSEQPSSIHILNDARATSGQYELRAEFVDRQGYTDSEGVVLDFGRALLFFTFLDGE